MKRNFLIYTIGACSILYSCNSNSNSNSNSNLGDFLNEEIPPTQMMTAPPPPPAAPEIIAINEGSQELDDNLLSTDEEKQSVTQKKIIKDGNLSVKTKDVFFLKKRIDSILGTVDAYYESENLNNSTYQIAYNLKIRVPAEKFETLLTKIENGEGEITNKSIRGRDVTEEYLDIEMRLENKREYLIRYKELLSKAITVKDILSIESEIRVLEEEIESSEGRLRYLSDQVAYSTLDLNLFKEIEQVVPKQDKFFKRVTTALQKGWFSAVAFILWIIRIWPFAILITVLVVFFNRRIQNRKLK